MGKTVKVECDGCGDDLTYATNSVDYRVVLKSEGKTPWYVGEGMSGGAMTDMMIYDPVPENKYFCGLSCLDTWRDRENHYTKLSRDWHENYKREHGTWKDGRCLSYPFPPDDSKLRASWRAAALEAFPMVPPKGIR